VVNKRGVEMGKKRRGEGEDDEGELVLELDIGDPKTIPRRDFLELIVRGKAIRCPAQWSKHLEEKLLKFLRGKAATADAIAIALGVPKDTVISAIEHLQFHDKRIISYFNKDDQKIYYVLEEEEERR